VKPGVTPVEAACGITIDVVNRRGTFSHQSRADGRVGSRTNLASRPPPAARLVAANSRGGMHIDREKCVAAAIASGPVPWSDLCDPAIKRSTHQLRRVRGVLHLPFAT